MTAKGSPTVDPVYTVPAGWDVAYPNCTGTVGPRCKLVGAIDFARVFDGLEALTTKLDGVAKLTKRLPLIGDRVDGGVGAAGAP